MNQTQDANKVGHAFDSKILNSCVESQRTKSEYKIDQNLLGKRQRVDLLKDFSKN